MSAINEPISVRIGCSKRIIKYKNSLAGKKPTVNNVKPIVSRIVKMKRRSTCIQETN